MTCKGVCHFLCFCSGISRNVSMRVDLLCGLPPPTPGGGGGGACSSVPSLAHVHKHNKHTRFADAAPLILHFCLFLFARVSPEDIYLFVRVHLSLFELFSGERLNRAALCLWCLYLIISDTDRLWKLSKQTEFIGSLDVWVVGLCSWDHHRIHYLGVEFWGESQIFDIVWKNWNWLK